MIDDFSEPISGNASARIEALLFVATNPVTPSQIAECLTLPTGEVESELKKLMLKYSGRGISIQHYSGKYQLTTAAEYAADVEKFLGLEITSRLSRAAVETMAIIAYRQPITRPGIEAIRGVSSDGVIRSLLSSGLIQEVGRADGPGRPILFSTTVDFLQHFGLRSLDELPPYEIEVEEEKPKNGLLKD
jgi:segregation and condensation protein B